MTLLRRVITVPLGTILMVVLLVSGPLLLAAAAWWDWLRGRVGLPAQSLC